MSQADTQMTFNAYALGHYIGSSRNFKEAVDMAYEHMGVVTDQDQNLVWDRVNRQPIVNIKDPMAKAGKLLRYLNDFTVSQEFEGGLLMVDARECSLSQILIGVDVHLDESDVRILRLVGRGFENRAECSARTAPSGPEVNEHDFVVSNGLLKLS